MSRKVAAEERERFIQPSPPSPPPYSHVPPSAPYFYSSAPPQTAPQWQQSQEARVTVVAPVIAPYVAPTFRDTSVRVSCPNCHSQVNTSLRFTSGDQVVLIAVIIFIVGLLICPIIWILIFIPFAMDSMKDVTHSCPVCKHELGCYKR